MRRQTLFGANILIDLILDKFGAGSIEIDLALSWFFYRLVKCQRFTKKE